MAYSKKRRVPNPTEQWVGLPYVMLRGDAWRSLSGAAVKVWLELRSRFNGINNGKLTLSLDEAAHLLHIGKATAGRAFKELEAKGFVKLMRRGQWYGRMASEWAVTDRSLHGAPPTRDWQRWQPLTAGKSSRRFPDGPIGIPDGPASEPRN